MNDRRHYLEQVCRLTVSGAMTGWLGSPVWARTPERTVIAVPGPGNLLFLPIALASRIGADQSEGLVLDIRYTGGGPQAFRDMLDRNSDFSAGGLSALALQKLSGKPVVCIVPVTRVPAYTLLVRSSLRGQVKEIRDLAGRVVGVKGHVPGGRSTSQLFTEHVLSRAGLTPQRVNYVAVGQAYDSQHAALVGGTVDAIMGDEPFATRLIKEKAAYALADYHDLETTRKQMGGLFLNGMVATREDVVVQRPDLTEKMVRTIKRSLVWIRSHSAEEVVGALALPQVDERTALRDVMRLRKSIYSPDGRFSDEQLRTVDQFLGATENTPAARAFSVRSIINSRWAGVTN